MSDAIAIIGLACRLPGAPDPGEFWRLLCDGVDAIGEPPDDRRYLADRTGVRSGGFLEQVDTFDADFFGISPREAASMDPQQRLMLELSWEALENARIAPDSVHGTSTGVFVGAVWDDYATRTYRQGPPALTEHTMTGVHRSIIANRVSYVLGLHGPSMAVDTGQSSSLVSVHLASESLRRGETDLAIAGGVNLNLTPESTLSSSAFGALSPDGRCYTFDARANGYVRGEGGAAVVLKPLSRALADGDPIYCVIQGSATNSDGATEGLTVPSREFQEDVLRKAYRDAGVDPADVQYVELHGTGTPLGDPIEAAALGAVLGVSRSNGDALTVGSAKTNVGHLEGAAGITGLLKAALSIRNREIPPSLNFERPNPRIPLADWGLRVQTRRGAWPSPGRRLVAGVSSFGMGGTNCHLVLVESPATEPIRYAGAEPNLPALWVLSGRSAPALHAQADRLWKFAAADPTLDAGAVGFSLATSRTAFEQRSAVVADDREGLLTGLRSLALGEPATNVVQNDTVRGGLAFLFSGQGFQRRGMGRALYDRFPAFAAAFDAVRAELDPRLDRPLTDVVWAEGHSPEPDLLDRTDYTQAALFAVEIALYRLLQSWGVQPDFVAGHSVGEFAAAHVAGVLPLAGACELVAARGRLMAALPPGGVMISLQAAEDEVRPLLEGRQDRLSIAAVNGPGSVVVSGESAAATAVAAHFERLGRRTRRLTVSHAFHSPLMTPALEGLREAAGQVSFQEPSGPRLVSTVTGTEVPAEQLRSLDYWVDHARLPVRFADCVRTLQDLGVRHFLEVGPGHGLTVMGQESVTGADCAFAPALETSPEQAGDLRSVTAALAWLHVRGADVDWSTVFGPGARKVELPTYAFQRRRHWLDESRPAAAPEPDLQEPATRQPEGSEEPAVTTSERDARDVVLAHLAAVLGHEAVDSVDERRSFRDLGLDSRMAVELRTRLQKATGLRLPTALVYNYPTPTALIDHLREQATGERVEQATQSPARMPEEAIAVVAMSCRYPGGVRGPDDLWKLVAEGTDAISEFPGNRGWNTAELYDPESTRPGTSYTRHGGFLHDADEFDAEFFGINAREATAMDPQQRLLLESSQEALERAGLDPAGLAGRPVGVYVGAMAQDYGPRLHESGAGNDGFGGYLLTGSTSSVASGRIAYVHGFQGPAITVDTACSSSLVAIHLAVRALRQGECDLALAGGVTVMPSPGMFVDFSKQHGLAPDGRCKPFAAGADGTAWAEGVGMLVLERLSDARRHGHPVLALVRGSAVNQDGASNGLTAPHGPSQERVIRQALDDARLSTGEVDAVEAHGTGTPLGDPIEAQALLATYGRNRPHGRPVWLGSLKSNIGHTQAAAGVGGVIKMVQAMRHGVLPATLHVDEPTPHVEWSAGDVSLLTRAVPWPANGHPRRAAISSFGISGTNAHLIVEEPPADATVAATGEGTAVSAPATGADEPVLWVVSARTRTALPLQAARLREFAAAEPGPSPADIGFSLATTRAQYHHRAVVVGTDRAELLAGLDSLARSEPRPNLVTGAVAGGGTVFVFPGQGSQWTGMGLELLESSPAFRGRLEECAEALDPVTGWSLIDVLRGEPGAPPLNRVDVVQPVLFAMMVSLAAEWRAHGVTPDAVVGHSQGEIAAACVAGALSLADAAKVAALRSRAIVTLAGTGGMASVPLSAAEVRRRPAAWDDLIHIASINGPYSTAVAGAPGELDRFIAACNADGVEARRIDVDYASHTPDVAVLRDQLRDLLAGIEPRPSAVPFFSTLTGERIDTTRLGPDYWFESLRNTVRFAPAARALMEAGHRIFVQVSPHPVLTAGIQDTAEDHGGGAVTLGSLRRNKGGRDQFLTSLAHAHAYGATVDWSTVFPGAVRVELPTYAFRRRRFWLEPPSPAPDLAAAGLAAAGHPLLSAAIGLPSGGMLFTGRLATRSQPMLADHAVRGTVLLPGTAFLEMALWAGAQVRCEQLDELTLEAPLPIPERGSVQLRVSGGDPDGTGHRSLTVHSRPDEAAPAEPWTRHAEGLLAPGRGESDGPSPTEPDAWPPPGAEPVDIGDAYDRLAARGYEYGPAFRGLRAVWRRGNELFAEVDLPDRVRGEAESYGLHPALLDSALHAWLQFGPSAGQSRMRLPFSWTNVALHAGGAPALRVRMAEADGGVTIEATDASGAPVCSVGGLDLRETAVESLRGADERFRSLFRVEWTPTTGPPSARSSRWAVLEGEGRLAGGMPGDAPAYPDLAALTAAVDEGLPVPDVVLAFCLEGDAGSPLRAAHDVTQYVLELVQAWLADERFATSRLALVTRRAVAVADGEDVPGLAQAPAWGLVRSAQSENPERLVLIDVDGGASLRALPAAATMGEPQVALRDGKVYAARLAGAASGAVLTPPADAPAWRLDVRSRGTLESLALLPSPEMSAPLSSGQVRIAVRAAGLNFKDVLLALSLIDDASDELLGKEGAGVVLEVGPDVTDLAVGDPVMGLFEGAFGPVAVTDRRLIVPVPQGWSFEEAASVPVVFLTAYLCLVDIAALRPDESVLIHAATGGVGMAAVQLARHLGAEVFATAGPGKHRALADMGLNDDHVGSSRSVEFEHRFTTAGGMNVVLNSLAGEFTDASLRLLSPGGRFVEMGKTDIRDPRQVGADHRGARYETFDLLAVPPDRIRTALGEVLGLFAQGALKPLPLTTYEVQRAPEAFRFLSQAQHIGKIVLTMPRPLDPRGTVLITGGPGTLGGLVARHLVTGHGIRHLVLTSRRGPDAPGVADLVARLGELGAEVTVAACDVADRQAVARVLSEVPEAHPLTAVVHTAGLLDDAVTTSMTPLQLERVMRPKSDGAWHLHELTADLDLTAFVMFSSAAGVLGEAGQGNYGAANALLDALAQRRRALGRPACSLAWGFWEQRTGMTGHLDDADVARMRRSGMAPLSTGEALSLLDGALVMGQPALVPMRLDAAALREHGVVPPLLRGLVRVTPRADTERAATSNGRDGGARDDEPLTLRLASMSANEQEHALMELVRTHTATVLGQVGPEHVEPGRVFKDLGFDSLTSIELRNRLAAATGVRLRASVTSDFPTPKDLTRHLLTRLTDSVGEGAGPGGEH